MDHHVEYLGTLELLEWYVLMMIWLWYSDYTVTYDYCDLLDLLSQDINDAGI